MQKLFTEFDSSTAQQWKEQLVKDLKGIDFEALVWKTNEGIKIQPFYTSENSEQHVKPIFTHHDWAICEFIIVDDELQANKQALDALANGASGLEFLISKKIDYTVLLKGILLEHIYSLFHLPLDLLAEFKSALKAIPNGNDCFINTDVIARLCERGNWHHTQNIDFDLVATNTTIMVDARMYQEAGANMINELSFNLSHLNEYLHYYAEANKLSQLKTIHISVSVGGNFFMEIAKLRSLRKLIDFLMEQYQLSLAIHIHAQTTSMNKSQLDSYNNLLRSTTEAMSASIGGSNSITVLPYDTSFNKPSNFSSRMARNQQLILKEESYLNKVADMAAGSYYIEHLTNQFCQQAWEGFKIIEEKKGFIHLVMEGEIQQIINHDAELLKEQFEKGSLVMVGVNKFRNEKETAPVEHSKGNKEAVKTKFEVITKLKLA